MTLHKGIDISNYQTNINYDLLKEQEYDTIIINCGGANTLVADASPNSVLNTHYVNARKNGFKTGFYFFVYWNASPKAQAQEFLNNINGKISDTRFFLDIEGKTEKWGTDYCNNLDTLAQEIIQEMQLLSSQQGLILDDSAFAIYSPSSFAVNEPISISKYGLWLADTNTDSQPTENSVPWAIVNGERLTFKNWIGLQWNTNGQDASIKPGALGSSSLDVDVFKEECYLNTPVTIGTTRGTVSSNSSNSSNNNLSIGTEVKITSGTNFAPNLIPSSDKDHKYTVDAVNESMCKLSGINEWVNFEFLNLVSKPTPPAPKPSNSNNYQNTAIYKYYQNSYPSSVIDNIISNAIQIYNYFKNEKWSSQAICGMLGNFSIEDPDLSPTTWEIGLPKWGPETGYGIAQWTPASDLTKICDILVIPYNELTSQCAAIQYEMTHGGQFYPSPTSSLNANEYMTSTLSPYKLGIIWLANYERPEDLNQSIRGTLAEDWYELLN